MSRIDELQRLHEAAAKGPWQVEDCGDFWRVTDGVERAFDDGTACGEYGSECSIETRDAIVALHNAWPAIHRVLVAARGLMQCPKCIGPCDDPTVHAELEEALRALDDKEQRT